ncbi:hypothetical protein IKB17_06210 [bacterium]|nr:hypothetical protein [bacterium]
MFGFKIITAKELYYLKTIENCYAEKDEALSHINKILNCKAKTLENLKNKLLDENTVICDIKKDKDGRETFIFMKDLREHSLKGELSLFVLNDIITPSLTKGKTNDVPYLLADFNGEKVRIDELHSDMNNSMYENKGYASMLVDTLIKIARKSKCQLIYGTLSSVDAKTEEQKNHRNNFYKHKGFTLSFDDDTESNGELRFML